MSRFRVGDVVVLNGHRLTVGEPDAEGFATLTLGPPSADGENRRVHRIHPDFLPDPEPREEPEPEWVSGDVVRDTHGDVYQRTPDGEWLRTGVLRTYRHASPNRPLTRLVPETAVPDDARDSWDTFGTKRGVVMADTAGTTQYMPDPYVCQRTVPDGGLADNGRRCGKRNPCPDHAVTYHDSEGDLEALARTVSALTPGQPVAHKDGRFGTYTAVGTGLAVSSALWRPFGELDSEYTAAADLRPVTLVERPDRDSALALMCPRIHSGRRDQVLSSDIAADIYAALFGPGEPS